MIQRQQPVSLASFNARGSAQPQLNELVKHCGKYIAQQYAQVQKPASISTDTIRRVLREKLTQEPSDDLLADVFSELFFRGFLSRNPETGVHFVTHNSIRTL